MKGRWILTAQTYRKEIARTVVGFRMQYSGATKYQTMYSYRLRYKQKEKEEDTHTRLCVRVLSM